jgi:hypothetical protein
MYLLKFVNNKITSPDPFSSTSDIISFQTLSGILLPLLLYFKIYIRKLISQ